jgi:hypothetical protein
MPNLQPRYSSDEFARRGRELYDRDIRPRTREEDAGRFVAIDIESGMFEIDDDDLAATERLLARRQDAQIWIEWTGSDVAYRIGERSA